MATLPTSLLSKMYEPNSLQNTESGFELAIKNRLAPSTVVGIGPLIIDGRVYDSSDFAILMERPAERPGRRLEPLVRRGSEVSTNKALPFDLNAVARVTVDDRPLEPGKYEVALSLRIKEVGDVTVRAVDRVT